MRRTVPRPLCERWSGAQCIDRRFVGLMARGSRVNRWGGEWCEAGHSPLGPGNWIWEDGWGGCDRGNRLPERLETCGWPPAAPTERRDACKGRSVSLTERREGCKGQVAGIARDIERDREHLAALTERRGSCTGRLAGLTRGRETCGRRVAGLADALGGCKGQVAVVAQNLDALDLPFAGVTALRRSLLGRWR